MARKVESLTEAQWALIAPLLPEPRASPRGGRKPIGNRACFEGILWELRSGARWKDLPERYPSPSTCWRRLRDCEEQGVWLTDWRALLGRLELLRDVCEYDLAQLTNRKAKNLLRDLAVLLFEPLALAARGLPAT